MVSFENVSGIISLIIMVVSAVFGLVAFSFKFGGDSKNVIKTMAELSSKLSDYVKKDVHDIEIRGISDRIGYVEERHKKLEEKVDKINDKIDKK